MADKRDEKGAADESAEKAYAAAAEAASGQSDAKSKSEAAPKDDGAPKSDLAPADGVTPELGAAPKSESAPEGGVAPKSEPAPTEGAVVAFPPKASRSKKASAPVKPSAPAPKKGAAAPPSKAAKSTGSVARKTAEKKAPAKPTVKKVAAKKPASPGKATITASAAPKPAAAAKKTSIPTKAPTIAQLKDKIMATTKTPDFTAGLGDTIADMQTKAKEAFEKSTSAFGDINDFAKGNVEAIVESGKILVSGLQEMGTKAATESRSAFDSMTADMKELAAAKSPADFFKLQSDITRRNFDAVVAAGSKNSEAMLKLASEIIAPISGRVSMAVETARKAI